MCGREVAREEESRVTEDKMTMASSVGQTMCQPGARALQMTAHSALLITDRCPSEPRGLPPQPSAPRKGVSDSKASGATLSPWRGLQRLFWLHRDHPGRFASALGSDGWPAHLEGARGPQGQVATQHGIPETRARGVVGAGS